MILPKEEKDRTKRYWRRRWLKVALIIFCFLFLLILISTLLIIPSNRFSQWLLHQVNQKLRQDFFLIVEADSVRLEIWRGRVKAEGFKIWPSKENKQREPDESSQGLRSSGEPILYFKKISLNLALLELIRGKLHFQEIVIDSPLLNLNLLNFKALNSTQKEKAKPAFLLEKSREGEKSERLGRFQIDRLQLEGGELNWLNGPVLSQVFLQGIGVEISFDERLKEHLGFLKLAKGEIAFLELPFIRLASSRLDFRFRDGEIFFDRLLLQGDGLSLEGSGHLSLVPALLFRQAKLKGEINLEKIPFFYPELKSRGKEKKEIVSQGKLSFSLDLAERGKEFRGYLQLEGKEVVVSVAQPFSSTKKRQAPFIVACPHLSGELKGSLEGKKINLELMRFDLPGLQFLSSGIYDGKNWEAKFELSFRDLSKTLKEMRLEEYLSRKMAFLKERIDQPGENLWGGQVELKGSLFGRWREEKDWPSRGWPEVEGQVELLGKNLVTPLGERGELTIKATLKEEKINFTRANFLSSPMEFSLKGFLSLAPGRNDFAQQSDFRASLKIKDLSELAQRPFFKFLDKLSQSNQLVKLESLNQKKEAALAPLSGALSLEARVKGDLSKPRLTFRLETKDLVILSEKVALAELEGTFSQSVLTITNFQLKKKEETPSIKANLIYDLGRKSFQAKIEAPPHNLADFSQLQQLFPLQGWLGLRMAIAGEKDNFYFSYRIDGNNINSKNFSLPRFQAEGDGTLRGGKIEAASLMLDLRPSGFNLYSLAIETPEPIRFTLSDKALIISGLILKEKDFQFNLQGSLGLREEKGELQLEAKLPLALARRYLSPELKEKFSAQGEILIKGPIGGFLTDLKPDITIELTDGSLTLTSMNLKAQKINFLAKLDRQAFVLENLSFYLGRGSVLVRASVPLKLIPPCSFPHFGLVPLYLSPSNSSSSGNNFNLVQPCFFPSLFDLFFPPSLPQNSASPPHSNLDQSCNSNWPSSNSAPSSNSTPPKLFSLNSSNSDLPSLYRQNSVISFPSKLQERKSHEDKGPEAEIELLFSHLNPLDLIGPALKNFPPPYQEKITGGEIGGEISGEINLSFLPSLKNGLSSLRGEGKIDPLKVKFDPLSLANKEPILFRFSPEVLIFEEAILEGDNFELRWQGEIKNPLNFKIPNKELLIASSQDQSLISAAGEKLAQTQRDQLAEAQIKVSPEAYLDLAVKASGDLETISSLLRNINLRGKGALNLSLTGPPSSLEPRAFAELRSLSLQLIDWPLRLSDMTGTFYFDGQKLEIQSCRGLVNGASWEVAGFLELEEKAKLGRDFKIGAAAGLVQIEAKEVPLAFEGVGSTEVSLSLNLEPGKQDWVEKKSWLLSGKVGLKKTTLAANIGPIWRLTRPKPKIPRRSVATAPPPFLQNLTLNVKLNLEEPLVINNPFLRAEMQGALTLSGPAFQPALLGRFSNLGSGELLWAERRYRLEKMEVAFTGAFPPDPQLDLLATTELIHRYDELEVSLNLSGPVSELRFQLQSTPPRSQEELAFILLTGRSPEEIRTQGLGALREQLLLSLATPTASRLGGAMRRLFGLEEVRFEPLGIASETDPGARLTLVKQITPAARITSSIDITNSQRQTWAVDYRLTKGMMLQALRLDNGSYGAGLRHGLSMGREWLLSKEGGSLPREKQVSKAGRIISKIELKGNFVFAEDLIRKKLGKLKPGKEFSSSLLDRQIRALESFYRQRGFLQVKIEPRRVMSNGSMKAEKREDLKRESLSNKSKNSQEKSEDKEKLVEAEKNQLEIILEIEAGPKIELIFEGTSLSRNWRRQIEAIWAQEQNLERAATRSSRLIEKVLKGKGYYQASASFELRDLDELKKLEQDKNLKQARIIELRGLKLSGDKEIFPKNYFKEDLKPQELKSEELNQEKEATFEGQLTSLTGVICHFSIKPGPRFRLGEVKIQGAAEGRGERLLREIKSWRTSEAKGLWLLVVEPKAVMEAIESWYESQGYLESKASLEMEERVAERLLNLSLMINEGPLSRVAEIRIDGNEAIKEEELRPRLRLREGEPFNPELILMDRNDLLSFYRSQGFREATVASSAEMMAEVSDVRIIFKVKEGLAYKIGEVDFSGVKESRQEKLAEIFGLKPGTPLNFEKISQGQKSLYETGDFSLVQVLTESLADKPGEEKVRVEVRPEPAVNFRYGLRYNTEEKTEFTAGVDFRHFFGLGRHGLIHFLHNARESDFRFSFHDRHFLGLKVNSLLSFYLTRRKEADFKTDEAGASWRHRLSLPGKIFLSTVIKRSRIHTYETEPIGPWPFDISLSLTELMLQAMRDTRDDPLDPRRGSFFSSSLTYSPEALKSELTYLSWFGQASFYRPLSSRLTWASNLRLGLATAFDQVMVPARRFYAGGAYSLRGFKQDMVGPYDPYLEQPEGGEAVFIANQELRWRFFGALEMAFFYDVGNVFPEVKDLSLTQLRHSLGFGLRLRSPIGLLRFDVGFNLKPKFNEPRQIFFFSLGPVF